VARIKPVKGLFQQLPPAINTFDLVLSVHGFPEYAYDHDKLSLKEGGEPHLDKETMRTAITLIAPGGEARFFPTFATELKIVEAIQKEFPGEFTLEMPGSHPSLMIIKKLAASLEEENY